MVPELEMTSHLHGFKPRPRDAPLLTIMATSDATVENGPPRVTSSRYPGPSCWLVTSRVVEWSNRIAVVPVGRPAVHLLGTQLNYFGTIFE